MRFSGVVCTIANSSIAVWRATRRCIQGFRFRVLGLGFRNVVQGLRIRAQESGLVGRRICASRVSEHLQVSLHFKLAAG